MTDSPARHTLADEHRLLMAEVATRIGRAIGALDHDRGPDDEIERLVTYLRHEVLDQAGYLEEGPQRWRAAIIRRTAG